MASGASAVARDRRELDARIIRTWGLGRDRLVCQGRHLGPLEDQLTAPDASLGDQFGRRVSMSGDRAVVGARFFGGPNSGKAYVYRRDGMSWLLEDELVGSDTEGGDQFGSSVSIHGDLLVVGARGLGGFSGLRIGGTAMGLLHRAELPLVVVPTP